MTHSDNFGLKGLEPVPTDLLDITFGDTVIATGKYDVDKNTIVYTFTDAINGRGYAKARAEHVAFDREEKIQNSQEQTFTVDMGETTDSITLNVDYGEPYNHEGLEGKSEFTEWNPETGEFTQIYYINPNSKDVNYSSENDLQLSVGVILHNGNDENEAETVTGYRSNVFFTNDNTKVTVYKLDKDTVMPHAVYGDWLTDDKIDTASEVGFNNQTGKARVNFNRKTIDNPYVIKVVSKVDPKKENINLYSAAKFYGNDGNFTTSAKPDGTDDNKKEGFTLVKEEIKKSDKITDELDGEPKDIHFIPNEDLEVTYVYRKDITSEDPVEEKGSFTEHHIYEVYKDGEKQEDQTTNIHLDKVEGTEEETFTTSAKPDGTDDNKKEGFTLVKEEIKKSDKITDELDGEPKDIHFIPNEDLEVTYVYRKDITSEDPMEERGSFTEIHEYYEYDKDGKLVNTNTITIPKTEGTKDEQFTTAAKPNGTEENPKEDFELVPERIEKSDEITKTIDGSEVKDNFVPKKELKVTYVYKKDTKTTTPEGPSDPTPGTPSDPTPGKPWNPGTPGGPVDPTPNKPSEPTPNKPGEPTAPEKQPKDKPSTDKPYAPEKTGVVKKSDKGDTTKKVETKAKDDADKAPQTFDAGVSGYFG
nr:fibrinogen-binding adhesin SdrG C-terminal domain-containing protein [Peptoniphilus ivorii]